MLRERSLSDPSSCHSSSLGKSVKPPRRGPNGGWLLECPSHIFSEALPGATGTNRVRCTGGKFCRRDGGWVFHDFDMATGEREDFFLPYRNPRELLGEE